MLFLYLIIPQLEQYHQYMNKTHKVVLVLAMVISFGATQTVPVPDLSCLRNQDFQATLEGLRSTITRSCLNVKACETGYMRYRMRKDLFYREGEGEINRISFKEFRPITLCTGIESSVFTDRIEAVTKFKIVKIGRIEKIELLNDSDQVMAVLVFARRKSGDKIRRISLQGYYMIYLPPLTVRFPSDGVINIQGCDNFSSTFSFSNDGSVQFSPFNRVGVCNSAYENLIIDALQSSSTLNLTNEDNCELSLRRNSATKYLDAIIKPLEVRQISIVGTYTLQLAGSDLNPIKVRVTDERLSYEGCMGNIYFNYTIDGNNIQLQNASEEVSICRPDNDQTYIENLRQIKSFNFDAVNKELILYSDNSQNPVYTTRDSKTPSVELPVLNGNFNLYLIGSDLPVISVVVDESKFQFTQCNGNSINYVMTDSNTIILTNSSKSSNNICPNDNDDRYVQSLRRVMRLEFDPNTRSLKLFGTQQTPIFSTDLAEYQANIPAPIINGLFTLYRVGTNLDPIQVTATDNRFTFRSCNNVSVAYSIPAEQQISFSQPTKSAQRDCGEDDHDRAYAEALLQVSTFIYHSSNSTLKLYDTALVYTTDSSEYQQSRPLPSIQGSYLLYPIGTDKPAVSVQFDRGEMQIRGCNNNIIFFTIVSQNEISFFGVKQSLPRQPCQNSNDGFYSLIFRRAVRFEVDSSNGFLRLFDENSPIPLYSTLQSDYDQNMPLSQQLVGTHTLYLIGSDLPAIVVTANENSFVFDSCNTNTVFYNILRNSNSIIFSRNTTSNAGSCSPENDYRFVTQFFNVTSFQFDPTSRALNLTNAASQLPIYSTDRQLYLDNQPTPTPSIAGNYALYLIGGDYYSIDVTVTDTQFLFTACSDHNIDYTITRETIQFSNSRSSNRECIYDNDPEYVGSLQISHTYTFDENTRELKLFDFGLQMIYSTSQADYRNSMPVTDLSARYNLYLVGTNLDPIDLTITDNSFNFTNCTNNSFTYTARSFGPISFSTYYSLPFAIQCITPSDGRYLQGFRSVDSYQLSSNPQTFKLFTSDLQMVYSSDLQDFISRRPSTLLAGNYQLYLIGSQAPPVTADATNRQLTITGCNSFIFDYTVTGNMISFTNLRPIPGNCTDSQNSQDAQYAITIQNARTFEHNPDTSSLKLFGQDLAMLFTTDIGEYFNSLISGGR